MHRRSRWCSRPLYHMCLSHIHVGHLSILIFCFPYFFQLWNNMQSSWFTLNSPLHSWGFVTDVRQLRTTSQAQDLSWNKEIGKKPHHQEKKNPNKQQTTSILWILFYWLHYKYPQKNISVPCIMSYQILCGSEMVLQLVRLVYVSIILLQRIVQCLFMSMITSNWICNNFEECILKVKLLKKCIGIWRWGPIHRSLMSMTVLILSNFRYVTAIAGPTSTFWSSKQGSNLA